MCPWFSTFLLNPFVNRVNRLIPIRIDKLLRSTNELKCGLIRGARAAYVLEQSQNGVLGNSSEAARSVNGDAFDSR